MKTLYERVKKWRKKNRVKFRAHHIVFTELRAKRLIKGTCFCGEDKVQAHHEDYSEPLNITWLCKRHHMEADKRIRDLSTF